MSFGPAIEISSTFFTFMISLDSSNKTLPNEIIREFSVQKACMMNVLLLLYVLYMEINFNYWFKFEKLKSDGIPHEFEVLKADLHDNQMETNTFSAECFFFSQLCYRLHRSSLKTVQIDALPSECRLQWNKIKMKCSFCGCCWHTWE